MDHIELRKLATKYLSHLMTNPEARAEFKAADKTDYQKLGELIRKHLNLAKAPGADDVQKMLAHSEELVKPLTDAVREHAPQYYEAMFACVIIGNFTK